MVYKVLDIVEYSEVKLMKKKSRIKIGFSVIASIAILLMGCGFDNDIEQQNDNITSDNVILTEVGEVIEKEEVVEKVEAVATPSPQANKIEPEVSADIEPIAPIIDFVVPEPEHSSGEEAIEETVSSELQLVFLGDSIFDNHRDGTGVPYLTAVKCDASLYNLAIGGTSATIEWDESSVNDTWSSRSLCGIVKAIRKEIPTDIFEGSQTKKILDNPDVDFSKTDYFIVEYGLNDYFRAVPLNIDGTRYDVRCYAGALRFAIDNLHNIAPDATIILCAPTYAQFYNGEGYMVGDGNVSNTGYGTLFDYKGTCNYVANEQQTLFFNAYQDLGIDGYTADKYLEDGVHLTEEGRHLYSDALAEMILNYEEPKNN